MKAKVIALVAVFVFAGSVLACGCPTKCEPRKCEPKKECGCPVKCEPKKCATCDKGCPCIKRCEGGCPSCPSCCDKSEKKAVKKVKKIKKEVK
jgi:hypothetical protein